MKKVIAIAVMVACLVASTRCSKAAPHYEEGVLYEIECTAYCDTGLTATGVEIPTDGSLNRNIAAFSPEYYGWCAVVTMPDGASRIYEIQDTGSEKCGIRDGQVMDLWFPTENACVEFGRQTLKVYFVKGVG